MKKLILTIIALCLIATPTWAADTKLSALTALEVAPAGTDQLYINDGGVSKRITIDYLFDYIEAANLTITGNWVNTANPWEDNEVADDITVTSTKKISTTITTEQLRLGYDATNYLTATLADDGHTTIVTVDPDGAEADININPDGNVGIKTANPSVALEVTGGVTASGAVNAASADISGAATFGSGNHGFSGDGDLTAKTMTFDAVTNPKMTGLDDDNPGTDKEIGSVTWQYLSGADGSEDGSMSLNAFLAGASIEWLKWDSDEETVTMGDSGTGEDLVWDFETATDNQVEVTSTGSTEILVTGIALNAGAKYVYTSTDVDVTVSGSSVIYVYNHASAVNYTLPADPEVADISGGGGSKLFCFRTRVAQVVTITPAAGDVIELDGADETAAEAINNDDEEAIGDFICLQGWDDGTTDRWATWGYSGSWNGATD